MAAALLAWTPQPTTGWQQGAAEATLFQLMNGARVNNGRRAVQQHGTLVSLARWRSKDQVDRNYFDHTILGTGHQVYHWYDINGLNYTWGGENIGWNNGVSDADSPVSIHQGFMDSPGHRANVLEPSFTHGGVGAYAKDNVQFLGELRSPRFYTELFMTAGSAPPPPPPSDPPPSGGGGGGGGGSSNAPAPANPAPVRPSRSAKAVRVDAPAPPRASAPMDGATVVASAASTASGPPNAMLRALAHDSDGTRAPAASVQVAGQLRVESAATPDRGLFETVVGSLLGFVF